MMRVRYHITMSEESPLSDKSSRSKTKRVTKALHEARGVAIDMAQAKSHPATLQVPDIDANLTRRLMHKVHRSVLRAGKIARKGYERKLVEWPVAAEPDKIQILGYGSERVVYKVQVGDSRNVVISVFHREGIIGDSHEVSKRKLDRHQTYERYFGDLVAPTLFLEVDNPWGEGKKPAALRSYVEEMTPLATMGVEAIRLKAQNDAVFASSLTQLLSGYQQMLNDKLVPDFADSNVNVVGSQIVLHDTGQLYTQDRLEHLQQIHPNFALLDQLTEQYLDQSRITI